MTIASWRPSSRLVAGLALAVSACAADPLIGVAPLSATTIEGPTLQVSYSVEGPRLSTAADVVYYFVLDTSGIPEDGPRINGAAPRSHPAPDARAFLPFYRSEVDILDREPVVALDSNWTDHFALSQERGNWVMWQGRRHTDGTITDRLRQLTPGLEWGIQDGRTVQLRVALAALRQPATLPPQFEANLVVIRRADDRGHVIDGWRPAPAPEVDPARRAAVGPFSNAWAPSNYSQTYFAIPTTGESRSETDTSPLAVPGNATGPANSLNLVTYSARVDAGPTAPASAAPGL